MNRSFELIPAIDLMDGKCVRLTRGKAELKTVYSDNPAEMALSFERAGAHRIHLVDLDGAFGGVLANLESIKAIRNQVKVKIEVGGGIRSEADLEALFGIGVDYCILGTKAVEDSPFLQSALRHYGEKIIVGIDAHNGKVAIRGWVQVHDITAIDFARQMYELGVKTIIYTDIATDGALGGPNLAAQKLMADSVNLSVIASGGIASIEDVKALASLDCPNLIGAITGKAIYDGRINLAEAIASLKGA
jgi:phosphoribosylformimino-5-aminoimidazole carboxamide ribotide isomerase